MTKAQALANIAALYRVFNAADSDMPESGRQEWTTPEMAHTCCHPLDLLLREVLPNEEERQAFYDTL